MFKPETLAKNIKTCRKKLELTQTELANKLFVSSQAISKWESGQSIPDLGNLCLLAEIFGASIDNLTGYNSKVSEGSAFIGVDGGATKTEFVLFTDGGNILKRIVLKGSNPNVNGLESAAQILTDGISSLLACRQDVLGVFAGVAGCGSGSNGEKMSAILSKTFPLLKISLAGDIANVFASATDKENCVAVICGTGFSIFAKEKDKLNRVGGWGYLLDDISGGYGLGRQALRAALAERDGFGEKTVITELVEQKLGSEVWKNIGKIYSGGDSFIASFAPLVFDAYDLGDKCAEEILDNHTKYIADLLRFTLNTYDCGNTIVMAGGLLKNNTVLLEKIKYYLNYDAEFIVPTLPQIFGACYKSLSLYGKPTDTFFDNFKLNYEKQI